MPDRCPQVNFKKTSKFLYVFACIKHREKIDATNLLNRHSLRKTNVTYKQFFKTRSKRICTSIKVTSFCHGHMHNLTANTKN